MQTDGSSSSADLAGGQAGDGPFPCAQDCDGVCIANQCIPTSGPCVTNADCDSDFVCYCAAGGDGGACGGVCIPWGVVHTFDPTCGSPTVGTFPSSTIELEESCHWDDLPTYGFGEKPLVGDLDHDGKPEIVFAFMDPETMYETGYLIAVHADDCSEVWRYPLSDFSGAPALADVDGDGFAEIFFSASGGNSQVPIILDHGGAVLAMGAPETFGVFGGSIANVDGVGGPEMITGGSAFRFQKGSAMLQTLFFRDIPPPFITVSVFADMDGDGKSEAVTGIEVFDGVTGANKTPTTLENFYSVDAEHTAVADFNGDGYPDLALVLPETNLYGISVFDYHNNKIIFGPYVWNAIDHSGSASGGAPTIDDFDGDGVPDIAIASQSNLCVHSLACAQNPRPASCSDEGVLWCKRISDLSSGFAGSTSFDFNADGIPEIVYRDECWLRIYEGSTGEVLYAQSMTSITGTDSPVVADVDRDGHADIVVGADTLTDFVDPSIYYNNAAPEVDTKTPWSGAKHGVFVFHDPMNRWPATRPIWSGHAYHITEIDDDLSVPPHEKPSWLAHNTYRRNAQAYVPSGRLPDLTARRATSTSNHGMDCSQVFWVSASVCNRGAHSVAAGLHGTFYVGDPRSGAATGVCTATTTQRLDPGTCQSVSCPWKSPPQGPQDLWFRTDDDGTLFPSTPECNSANDVAHLPSTCSGGST
jgi:hypothetical protein